MQLSIVIPLLNEAESLPELYRWLAQVMKENNYSYEILFIDDGSTDDSWEIISEIKRHTLFKKLWKITGFACWFPFGKRSRCSYYGCGFTR